jgi:tetratricopeptide (TPR) repeat protein
MKNAWISLAAVCALVVGVYAYMAQSGVLELVSPSAADTFYNLLVQGFRAGQLSLKKEAPPGFSQLAAPYDPAANVLYLSPPYRLLNLSYYKGKFYIYWGVTPALILFWPYVALTGHYLFHRQAVVIFCAMGFLASVGLLRALWRRYFSEVSVWVVTACVLALGLATGVPALLSQCDVYEVSVTCGYMLTMLALAAIWKALHHPSERGWWLAVASLAYGLAVGARPSLLFAAVILLVPVAQAWRQHRKVWTPLLAATGPILLIGLGLMFYNELRFDNPLEFGVRYQLCLEQQLTRQLFSLRYLRFNFWVYFLEPARWSVRSPFASGAAVPPLPSGYGPVRNPFGVLTNIPLAWLALTAPLAWRSQSGQAATILRWFVTVVALLFGICALTVGLFWSANLRYEVDFLPALLLLAVVGILGLECALADRPAWLRAVRLSWGLLLGFSVAFNLLVTVGYYAEAQNSLATTLFRLHSPQEAISHWEQALRLNPDYVEVHNNLGNALAGTGKIGEAIAHYEQALRIKPDFAVAHINLANALAGTGKTGEAIAHDEQALRIKPDFAEAYNNLAWLLATHTPAEGGDAVRAADLAQRACELTSNRRAGYLDTLAAAYAAAGRFNEAVATAQKAIELARAAGQPKLVGEYEARLELYRSGHAYFQSVGNVESKQPLTSPSSR